MKKEESSKILGLIQKEFPGYHPLLSLARIAHKTADNVEEGEEAANLKLQTECHQTIAKYTEQQLKSVEVQANVKSDFGMLRVQLHTDKGHVKPEDVADDVAVDTSTAMAEAATMAIDEAIGEAIGDEISGD